MAARPARGFRHATGAVAVWHEACILKGINNRVDLCRLTQGEIP